MPDFLVSVSTPADVALSAATVRTIIQVVAPTNQRLAVAQWGLFFDGVSPTAVPVLVELLRQTSAGTSSSVTPVRVGAGSETPQATCGYAMTSTEPTSGDILVPMKVHPQSGFAAILPLNAMIEVPGGTRLGIRATAAATVNVRAYLWYFE